MVTTRRVTIKEVARRAGVSYQTVSKLLNGQVRLLPATADRIWNAVRELNYRPLHPARSLRLRQSRTIGYSWRPSTPDHPNQILDTLLQSMLTAAEEQGYHLLCFAQPADLDTYQELFVTGRIDGFILSSIEYDDPRIRFLQEHGIPFTAFGRSSPGLSFPCIDVDGGEGISLVVNHLIERGHSRIAILAWPEQSRVGNNRLDGYYQAMRQAGIDPHPTWVIRTAGEVETGYRAAVQLLHLPHSLRPTAIVCLNDYMAIGALRAAQEHGFSPGHDLAISGFDDTPLARYHQPALTTIRQPIWQIGQQLIQLILAVLHSSNNDMDVCRLLPPELVVRESTLTGQPTVS